MNEFTRVFRVFQSWPMFWECLWLDYDGDARPLPPPPQTMLAYLWTWFCVTGQNSHKLTLTHCHNFNTLQLMRKVIQWDVAVANICFRPKEMEWAMRQIEYLIDNKYHFEFRIFGFTTNTSSQFICLFNCFRKIKTFRSLLTLELIFSDQLRFLGHCKKISLISNA